MEKRDPPQRLSDTRPARMVSVRTPSRHEGIGNALRAAFDFGTYGLPDDLMRLVTKLDR